MGGELSRTKRKRRPQMGLGDSLAHKQDKDGLVRDGTPTHYSASCENNGGCPKCEGNRLHKHKRSEPIS